MKYHINRHESRTRITTILELDMADIHIIGYGIHIDNVLISDDIKLCSIYPNPLPARIDRQGETIYLLDDEYVKHCPQPKHISNNYKLFGTPETIWRQ